MKMHVKVFWVMMCSVAVGYQHFRGPCFMKMEGARSCEMLISCHNAIWHHNQEDLDLKHMKYFKGSGISFFKEFDCSFPSCIASNSKIYFPLLDHLVYCTIEHCKRERGKQKACKLLVEKHWYVTMRSGKL
jgi:CO dehydrogenase/acetyl-CoA synthase alpha subunit